MWWKTFVDLLVEMWMALTILSIKLKSKLKAFLVEMQNSLPLFCIMKSIEDFC